MCPCSAWGFIRGADWVGNDGADLQKFLQNLSGWKLYDASATINDAYPGTCQWILDQDRIKAWRSEPRSGLLFILGESGSGKSVLAKHISRHCHETEFAKTLSFYCRGVAGECYAFRIVEAFLYQLLSFDSQLYQYVPVKYRNLDEALKKDQANDNASLMRLEDLWEILTNLIYHARFPKLYAFIDGLDECEHSSKEALLILLERLFNKVASQGAGAVNVKICVTCLPLGSSLESVHQSIYLRDHPAGEYSNAELLDRDIEQVVQTELSQIGHRYTPELRRHVEEQILLRAQGMFHWVRAILDNLRNAESTPETVENILRSFPSDMNGYYSRIFRQLKYTDPNGTARRILLIILFAATPLDHEQLAQALAMRPGYTSVADLKRTQNLDIVGWIYSHCSELVRSNGSSFELVHYSLAEYLNHNLDVLTSTLGSDVAHAHLAMARLCISYILLEDFCAPLRTTNNRETFKVYPFLRYAAVFWPWHLRGCGNTVTEEFALFSQFLDSGLNCPSYRLWCKSVGWEAPHKNPAAGVPLIHTFAYYGCVNAVQAMAILMKPYKGDSIITVLMTNAIFLWRLWTSTSYEPHFGIVWDIDESEIFGKTALTCAVEAGDWDMVIHLAGYGPSPDGRPNDLIGPLQAAARKGYINLVDVLIRYGATIDLLTPSGVGDTKLNALHWACANDHCTVVEFLLDSGANIDALSSHQDTPLLLALQNRHYQIARILIERGSNLAASEISGTSALILASSRGALDIVQLLLQKGADADKQNAEGLTALHWATSWGHEQVVKELLHSGANSSIRCKQGALALNVAARRGNASIAHMLLEAGADPNEYDGSGCAAIHHAADVGCVKVIEILLDHKANIDLPVSEQSLTIAGNTTALNIAARHGKLEAVKSLIERGANIEIENAIHMVPLQSAAKAGRFDVVHLMMDSVKVLGRKGIDMISSSMIDAAMNNQGDIVQYLLDEGADPNHPGAGHYTALDGACNNGNVDIIHLLLEKGASLEAKASARGHTALYHAVQRRRYKVVKALIHAGARKDCITADGMTLLHAAAENGSADILELLLELPKDPAVEIVENEAQKNKDVKYQQTTDHQYHDNDDQQRDLLTQEGETSGQTASLNASSGSPLRSSKFLEMIETKTGRAQTALALACSRGNIAAAKVLIEAGSDIYFRYSNGVTILHEAVFHGHHDLVRMLISKTQLINDSALETQQPIHLAAYTSSYESCKILLEAGAEPDRALGVVGTPLMQAAMKGDSSIISFLLSYGAVVDQAQSNGAMALHLATRLSQKDAIFALLGAGANANLPDPWTGSTLPHESSFRGWIPLIHACLSLGVLVDATDPLGRTPLMKSVIGGHNEVTQLLIASGASTSKRDIYGYSAYDYSIFRSIFHEHALQILYYKKSSKPSPLTDLINFVRIRRLSSAALFLSRLIKNAGDGLKDYFLIDLGRTLFMLNQPAVGSKVFLAYTMNQFNSTVMREMPCHGCGAMCNWLRTLYMCERCPEMYFCAVCFTKFESDLRYIEVGVSSSFGASRFCKGHSFIRHVKGRAGVNVIVQSSETWPTSNNADMDILEKVDENWDVNAVRKWLSDTEAGAQSMLTFCDIMINRTIIELIVRRALWKVVKVSGRAYTIWSHWNKPPPPLSLTEICGYRCVYLGVFRASYVPGFRTPGSCRVYSLRKSRSRWRKLELDWARLGLLGLAKNHIWWPWMCGQRGRLKEVD